MPRMAVFDSLVKINTPDVGAVLLRLFDQGSVDAAGSSPRAKVKPLDKNQRRSW
jgi:hypothetical protein